MERVIYYQRKALKTTAKTEQLKPADGYDLFKTFATKSIGGIREFLKDKFTDLKETVIDITISRSKYNSF